MSKEIQEEVFKITDKLHSLEEELEKKTKQLKALRDKCDHKSAELHSVSGSVYLCYWCGAELKGPT